MGLFYANWRGEAKRTVKTVLKQEATLAKEQPTKTITCLISLAYTVPTQAKWATEMIL